MTIRTQTGDIVVNPVHIYKTDRPHPVDAPNTRRIIAVLPIPDSADGCGDNLVSLGTYTADIACLLMESLMDAYNRKSETYEMPEDVTG